MNARIAGTKLAVATAVVSACAAGLVGGEVAMAQGAGAPHAVAATTTTYRMEQLMPKDGELSIIRNGRTGSGTTTLSLRLKSNPYATKYLVERADGSDLGTVTTIKAKQHGTVVLARNVPANTDYNIICFQTGAHAKAYEISGSVTEGPTA